MHTNAYHEQQNADGNGMACPLMKRHNITEYDGSEAVMSLNSIAQHADSDDETILKTRLFDVIMQSCGVIIDLRNSMMRLAFPVRRP